MFTDTLNDSLRRDAGAPGRRTFPGCLPRPRRRKQGAEADRLPAQAALVVRPIPPIRKTRKIACPKTICFAGIVVIGRVDDTLARMRGKF